MSDASFITSTPHTSTTRLTGGHAPAPQSTFLRCREMLRESIAEFLGVAVLVIFGAGVNCQVLLSSASGVSSSPKGDYLSVCFGWAVGLSLGIWVSNGISPGHINPAVTLAMATWRGFPWKKVPGFILAQILGGFVGAALVYANYSHAIAIFEGGAGVRTMKTAGVFGAYAVDYLPNGSAFFSEALGTAVLVLGIDHRDHRCGAGCRRAPRRPLPARHLRHAISAALGMQTSFSLNPARDFGPRLLSAAVGYRGAVFSYRSQYWLWTGVLGPVVGAQAAAGLYDLFLYNGPDGVVGKRTGAAKHAANHAADAV
ncbi:putative aquaporin 6 [Mycena galericulata]|nr:putative aquaporin 6 [Mycena galericulata]